jgi:integrase
MSTIKRGNTWWYEFSFQGVRIRESSHSRVRVVAERLERERRRKLELGMGGIKAVQSPRLFSGEAKNWLEVKAANWSASNRRIEGYNIEHLLPHFGKMLLTDITADDIARYQAARKKEGAGPRTINIEVGSLRAILRRARLWANLQPDVKLLRTPADIGRAISADEQHRLLTTCKRSRSRSLYPAFLLSLHTGLRNGELRHLRWHQVDLIERTVTVGISKTKGGEGRLVPLSNVAFECLQDWRSKFPNAQPSHFVFPTERYGQNYKTGTVAAYDIDPTKPIGSWKVAWTTARDAAMMERYSHTRNERKREAISIFDKTPTQKQTQNPPPEGQDDSTIVTGHNAYYQKRPQSESDVSVSIV